MTNAEYYDRWFDATHDLWDRWHQIHSTLEPLSDEEVMILENLARACESLISHNLRIKGMSEETKKFILEQERKGT